MQSTMDFSGRWVVVTGASSGLGEEMARQLSAQGACLVLVARRAGRLNALKAELQRKNGTRCHVITADLSDPDDVDRVFEEASAACDVYAVVLNAGITLFGPHLGFDGAEVQRLIATNVTSVVRLTQLFLPGLIARHLGGGILLVSSVAGLLPVPYQSAYSGSKAFISHFGQGLAQELRGTGVSVTVFCPGGIDTAMTRDGGLSYFVNTPFVQDVASCAADGIDALRLRKTLFVPGFLNRMQLFASRFVPRLLVARIAHDTYRRALDNA